MNYLNEFMGLSITYKLCILFVTLFVIIFIYCLINRVDLLDIQNSKLESFSSNSPTFTMYYTDWCGYCKKAKPEFKRCIETSPTINNVNITYEMVDCEKNKEKAQLAGVNSYPTFILNVNGENRVYKGPRKFEAFNHFLQENIQ